MLCSLYSPPSPRCLLHWPRPGSHGTPRAVFCPPALRLTPKRVPPHHASPGGTRGVKIPQVQLGGSLCCLFFLVCQTSLWTLGNTPIILSFTYHSLESSHFCTRFMSFDSGTTYFIFSCSFFCFSCPFETQVTGHLGGLKG